nr:hypothetical protein [Paenibacillus elgii]
MQNEWAKRNVKGNDENEASAVLLKSSSGFPHAKISALQRKRRRKEGFNTDIVYEYKL